jgi:hypothetical protein
MKTNLIIAFTMTLLLTQFITTETTFSQGEKGIIKKYMQ